MYPLLAPGGVPVTRAFPLEERPAEAGGARDHPHHRSLWFAHGDVNGHDFWHGAENRIENAGAVASATGGAGSLVTATNLWIAGDEPLLVERRAMAFALADERRAIDFAFELAPVGGPVTFGDTKEGTFALRLHPALCLRGEGARGEALSSEGTTGVDVWGERARWVAYRGLVEGREVTVALLDHPENPRHPTWWHARDYGLVAANPFGASDFDGAPEGTGDLTLEPGQALRLRYRVLLLAGLATAEELRAEWERFAR